MKGNDALGGSSTLAGLAASDVFYFGNRIGDTGTGTATLAITSVPDETSTRNNTGAGASITNVFDHDRNGLVAAADATASRNNIGTMAKINIPTGPPGPAPLTAGGDGSGSAVASALAAPSVTSASASVSVAAVVPQAETSTAAANRQAAAIAAADAIAESLTDDESLAELIGLAELGLDS
jgi:hypothetical protein